MAALGGVALMFLFLILFGNCFPTGPPGVTEGQLRLVTEILNAVHLESAASRVSTLGPLLLFLVAILIPLFLVIWLISLALRARVDHEEGLRTMLKSGFSREVTRAYLDESARRLTPPKPADDQKRLPQHEKHPGRRRTRRRRRRRANRSDRSDEETDQGEADRARELPGPSSRIVASASI